MPKKNYVSHYDNLKDKWTDRHSELNKRLVEKHADALDWIEKSSKHLAVGSLASVYLLTSPINYQALGASISGDTLPNQTMSQSIDKKLFLIHDLKSALPEEVRELTPQEEANIASILKRDLGFNVTAELDGKRLNRSYGLIGAEQHLARYPGDTMESHFASKDEADMYWSSGMAPGLGAWRHFAQSKDQMTKLDVDREKYYIAVQTFLAPGFHQNVREYVNFFKYRKMLVVNPQNGKAMVVVIGDAGPAAWTGKHLGGSPEVMKYLERVDGRQRGPVLYYFLDDPEDKIPLGPVDYN